ncbi:MAG: S8 family serine peptidase [Candidatus Kapaibacteriota bacterium]
MKFWFAVLLFGILSTALSSQEFLPSTLVVKFKEDYFTKKFTTNDSNLINILNKLLGNFNFEPTFNHKLIDFGLRKYATFFRKNDAGPLDGLKRIYTIKFSNAMDPLVASKKLENLDLFEYVEPYFIHRITSLPDDPLAESQYYFRKIQAIEAWQLIDDNSDSIVVGIVDTGVDIDHEDLNQNIFVNPGEIGLDSLGRDKSSNGVDDDGNGFVDDFVGWDFAGSNGNNPDNNPRPGNGHGTHVSGIIGAMQNNQIGIAGLVPGVRILPVKSASDEPFNAFITKGYEGILYAGVMGAKVINCSWGSEAGSSLENDVIRAVNSLGACVVAAAGNDGKYSDFAPASLEGVLSVAAVDSNDVKAGFSNFSARVGVSAPGVKIMSTTPGNTYAAWDGTSMASPIASAVVALARKKFPFLTYEQIYELVKKQSDNIDSLNPTFQGLIGFGRVNAFKALNCNPDTIRSIILLSYRVIDYDGDSLFLPNDTLKVFFRMKNVMSDLHNVYLNLPNLVSYFSSVIKSDLWVGDVPKFKSIETTDSIVFVLAASLPLDFSLKIPIDVYDSLGYISRFFFEIQVNPTFRTMAFNNLKVTFNSRGNIGFNDYPQNKQGVGFVWKYKPNVLFEGGMLVAYDKAHIYDVVRSSNQSRQSNNFIVDSIISISFDKERNVFIGRCSFKTQPDSLFRSDLFINSIVYQPIGQSDSNLIFVNYKVKNNTSLNLDSLFIGLFFDWDIGISGQNDFCIFDLDYNFGYAYNRDIDTLFFVGIKPLGKNLVNFYAIDNDGLGEDSLGIYDGFTKSEKWYMLTGGIKRKSTRATDASMIISQGPIKVDKDSIAVASFALFAGNNIFELRRTSIFADSLAYKLGLADRPNYPKELDSIEITIYPNPSLEDFTLRVSFLELQPIEVTVYDYTGRIINKFSYNKEIPWTIERNLGLKGLSSGNYFVNILTPKGKRHFLLTKVK